MPEHALDKYNLLLVDDDPFIIEGIGEDLERRGYRVTRVNSGEKAVELLQLTRFDLVITDLIMERTDGIQVLKKSNEIDATAMVIILTGFGDMLSAIEPCAARRTTTCPSPASPRICSFGWNAAWKNWSWRAGSIFTIKFCPCAASAKRLKIECQSLFRQGRDGAEKRHPPSHLQHSRQLDRARRVSLLFWHVSNQAWLTRIVVAGIFPVEHCFISDWIKFN